MPPFPATTTVKPPNPKYLNGYYGLGIAKCAIWVSDGPD